MTLDCTCNRLAEAERKAALWDGIVRCRDCRWHVEPRFPFKQHGCIRFWAKKQPKELFNRPILHIEPDGFCFWGERREDV